jgi:hypothetical protein
MRKVPEVQVISAQRDRRGQVWLNADMTWDLIKDFSKKRLCHLGTHLQKDRKFPGMIACGRLKTHQRLARHCHNKDEEEKSCGLEKTTAWLFYSSTNC